jgi:radical SAM protein with 4Fe4S-binding SPASM domain
MSISQAYDFVVQWHLTEKCNLRCRHCYQEGGQVREIPFAAIKAAVDEVSQMLHAWQEAYGIQFSPSFNVTGGEPFLRKDFFTILEKMMGAGFACYVLSNGTLIDKKTARKLADVGAKGVQVSLEGPEEIHEAIRGEGSFAPALQGIRNLLAAGVPVSVNTTLSRLNGRYFLDLADLAVSMGVSRIGFSRLVPSGQGQGLMGQMLEPAEVRRLYERVLSLKLQGFEIVSGDPVAAQMGQPAPAPGEAPFPSGGCAAGVAGLTIMADGTVTPCRRLPIPLGQIGRDSLREIWAVSPVLEALRDKSRYRGRCGSCARWSHCRGCRAIAYGYSRSQGPADFLAEDPQCFIEAG